MRLGELPLLAESLRRLDESDAVDGVVLVVPVDWEQPAILLAEELGASKVASCVTGGETRSESVRLGVAEVPDDAAVIVVHDAARPVLPDDMIPRLLEALALGWDGAVPGLPVTDTVKRVQAGGVAETLVRDELGRRADAAGVRRVGPQGRGRRRGLGLRVARRGGRRARRGRGG